MNCNSINKKKNTHTQLRYEMQRGKWKAKCEMQLKKRRKKQALVTYIRKDFIFYCLMCFFVFDKKKERARARERECEE